MLFNTPAGMPDEIAAQLRALSASWLVELAKALVTAGQDGRSVIVADSTMPADAAIIIAAPDVAARLGQMAGVAQEFAAEVAADEVIAKAAEMNEVDEEEQGDFADSR